MQLVSSRIWTRVAVSIKVYFMKPEYSAMEEKMFCVLPVEFLFIFCYLPVNKLSEHHNFCQDVLLENLYKKN